MLRIRIIEIIWVFEDFGEFVEEGWDRVEYINQFLKDVCVYYGYNEFLVEKLMNFFFFREVFVFFEVNESVCFVVICINIFCIYCCDFVQVLINCGVILELVGKWFKVGL